MRTPLAYQTCLLQEFSFPKETAVYFQDEVRA